MALLDLLTSRKDAVIYEVTAAVDIDRLAEYDDWLLPHIREMLAFAGFQSATVWQSPDLDSDGRARRIIAYRVRTRRELESYLHTHAARMREDGVRRFGEALAASRRIVKASEYEAAPDLYLLWDDNRISQGKPVCSNCHQLIESRFCGNCGQEDRTFLLSLRELILDFVGDLFNFDSRFFKTMIPLLVRPGFLTVEYIRGRRQLYFPPVRLYIFISLVFFFIIAITTEGVNLDIDEPDSNQRAEIEQAIEGIKQQPDFQGKQAVIATLEAQLAALDAELAETEPPSTAPGAAETAPPQEPVDTNTDPAADTADDQATAPAEPDPDEKELEEIIAQMPSLNVNSDGSVRATGFGSPELEARLERGLKYMQSDPKQFSRDMLDQIPTMMFVFLPILALMLKVLYLFTGRYYVEHLIFALHFHSAVFMLILIELLNAHFGETYQVYSHIDHWISLALGLYIPYYLYRSMRVVYAQGRWFTALKFSALTFTYFAALVAVTALALILTLYQKG